MWFGRCVIVCVCVKIFKAVNEWTAGVLGFQCGEDTGGGETKEPPERLSEG